MPQGIQDNNKQRVDLIFTKRGRFLKSINSPMVEITKFALSDDGVDYDLFDETLEEDEKGLRIIRTPQLEAFTSETAMMRNKLISLERDTTETATMDVTPDKIVFEVDPDSSRKTQVESVTIRAGFPAPNGFVVTLANAEYVYVNEPPSFERDDTSDREDRDSDRRTPRPSDNEGAPRRDGSGGTDPSTDRDDRDDFDIGSTFDLPPDMR